MAGVAGGGMNSVTIFALARTQSSPSLFRNPLCQFLQVGDIHSEDKLLSVDVMNGQDVVVVENNLVTPFETMQP